MGGGLFSVLETVALRQGMNGVSSKVAYSVFLSSYSPNTCALLQAGTVKASGKILEIDLEWDTNDVSKPAQWAGVTLTGGKNTLPNGDVVTLGVKGAAFDAACASMSLPKVSGGGVVITSASDAKISGTYEFQFSGGSLKGAFDVDVCEGKMPAPTCVP